MAAGLPIGLTLVVLAALAQGPPEPSPTAPPLTDPAFDQAFVCPEDLPGEAARRQAMVVFFHWAEAAHPDWSLADTVEFKKTLLIRHHCEASLRDLADYAKREH